MSILKVSVYQKPLNEGLNLTILKKLAAIKSDFLVLPEYFYLDSNIKDDQALLDRSQFAQDWIQKLSDAYHGVIIGGTILRTEESASKSAVRCSTPIVSNGEIIDWYNKRNPADYDFEKKAVAGAEEGVYILGGHRFAVLNGRDLMKSDEIARLAADGIKIILAPFTYSGKGQSSAKEAEQDENEMVAVARNHDVYIVRCCASGAVFGTPIRGRSLVATPTGISWRVSPHEEQTEILKTIMVNIAGA